MAPTLVTCHHAENQGKKNTGEGVGWTAWRIGFCGHQWKTLARVQPNGVFRCCDRGLTSKYGLWRFGQKWSLLGKWWNTALRDFSLWIIVECQSLSPPPTSTPWKAKEYQLGQYIGKGGVLGEKWLLLAESRSADDIGLVWFNFDVNYWLTLNYWHRIPILDSNKG